MRDNSTSAISFPGSVISRNQTKSKGIISPFRIKSKGIEKSCYAKSYMQSSMANLLYPLIHITSCILLYIYLIAVYITAS